MKTKTKVKVKDAALFAWTMYQRSSSTFSHSFTKSQLVDLSRYPSFLLVYSKIKSHQPSNLKYTAIMGSNDLTVASNDSEPASSETKNEARKDSSQDGPHVYAAKLFCFCIFLSGFGIVGLWLWASLQEKNMTPIGLVS